MNEGISKHPYLDAQREAHRRGEDFIVDLDDDKYPSDTLSGALINMVGGTNFESDERTIQMKNKAPKTSSNH